MSQFAETYDVALMQSTPFHVEKVHTGSAPTLFAVSAAYGRKECEKWLATCAYYIVTAIGASGETKTGSDSVFLFAQLFLTEYGYLNAAEVLLFIHRCAAGRYGEFYGSFSPNRAMTFVRSFLQERAAVIEAHKRKEEAQERAEASEVSVSRAQYEAIKRAATNGDLQARDMLAYNPRTKKHEISHANALILAFNTKDKETNTEEIKNA